MLPNDYPEIHQLLNKLWTQAVGTPDYVKEDWRKLEGIVSELWTKVTGLSASPLTRDQKRLLKAKAVLAKMEVSRPEVLDAIASIQSTDDPDPEFMRVHDALWKLYHERWPETG